METKVKLKPPARLRGVVKHGAAQSQQKLQSAAQSQQKNPQFQVSPRVI